MIALAASSVLRITERRQDVQQPPKRQCANAEDCSLQGLNASIRAAVAAEDAVTIAIWQLVLSALGVGAVGWALIYSAHTNRIAAEANSLAQQLWRAERRPWLKVELERATIVCMAPPERDFATLYFKITNIGQHPATNIHLAGEEARGADGVTYLNTPGAMIREAQEDGGPPPIGNTLFPSEALKEGRVFTIRRRSVAAGGIIAGYVEYHSSLSSEPHYTPWAFDVRYARSAGDVEVEASVSPSYLVDSPT